MPLSDDLLAWPYSPPEEIYLGLAEGLSGSTKLSKEQTFQGHAILKMCSEFDFPTRGEVVEPVVQNALNQYPISACGLTMEVDQYSLIFHKHFASRIAGALEAALRRLYPQHAGHLSCDRLDVHGVVIHSGMSIDAAVDHPFFQGVVGLLPPDRHARARLELRDLALTACGLPPMGSVTRRRVKDFLVRENGDKRKRIQAFWSWASTFLGQQALAEGPLYLRHAIFFERRDYEQGSILGAPPRRLRFLEFFPGTEPLFAPIIPKNDELCRLRHAVQAGDESGGPGALSSRETIDVAGRRVIGERAWNEFLANPEKFVSSRK